MRDENAKGRGFWARCLEWRQQLCEDRSTAPRRMQILLKSGNSLDLSYPDPNIWTNQDLAERLSTTARWAGSSKWTRPLSVAQHSILVLRIRGKQETALTREQARYELLHDAEEGFLGFDPITPLKSCLGDEFNRLCDGLKKAIATRYRLPALTSQQWTLHKWADRCAAASEALHVAGWTRTQIKDELQINAPILCRDPLYDGSVAEEGYAPWEPWDAGYAAGQFLQTLELLASTPDVLDQAS